VSESFASWNRWDPLPEMLRNEADMVVRPVSMGNIQYNEAVNDPVFAAHQEISNITSRSGTQFSLYHADFPVNAGVYM
jgi:hypothetical protein